MKFLRQRTCLSHAAWYSTALLAATCGIEFAGCPTVVQAGGDAIAVQSAGAADPRALTVVAARDTAQVKPYSQAPEASSGPTAVAAAQKPQDLDSGSIIGSKPNDVAADVDDVSVNMSNVQRVRIRTNSAPELGGEYIINNGTISIPMIGRFNVRGKRLSALEELISTKLSRALRRDVQVSIEIDRYMPFYIVGGVATAGEQEWRQGMTIIQAIGGSGGIVSQATVARSSGSDAATSAVKLRFALAQIERLKAERDNNLNWQPSKRLIDLEREANTSLSWSVADYITHQRKMLERQRADTRSIVEGLEWEREAAVQEVSSYDKQMQAVSQQLDIANDLSHVGTKLRDKGLVPNSQFLQQRIELLRANVTAIEAKTNISKIQAKIGALERQIKRITQERAAVVADKIESLERDIAEYELSTGTSTADLPTTKSIKYAIARKTDNKTATTPADLFSEILPGDVVIVSETADAANAERSDLNTGFDDASAGVDLAAAVRQRTQRFLEQANSLPVNRSPRGPSGAQKASKTTTQ